MGVLLVLNQGLSFIVYVYATYLTTYHDNAVKLARLEFCALGALLTVIRVRIRNQQQPSRLFLRSSRPAHPRNGQ